MHSKNYTLFIGFVLAVFAMLFSLHFMQNVDNLSQHAEVDQWSEPGILFLLPDSVDGARYLSGYIDKGKILLVNNYLKRAADFRSLEFSYIMKTEIDTGGSRSDYILSDTNYMAEGPSVHIEQNNVHVIWGERREDPDFETWEFVQSPIGIFTTTLFYTNDDLMNSEGPVELYHAGLSDFGVGAIRPPQFHLKTDQNENIHVVLQSWRFDDRIGGDASFITYVRNKCGDVWEQAQFPIVDEDGFSLGVEPVIETHSGGRLIIAFLGGDHNQPQGSNDVLIVTSNDSGDSWKEPQAIYISGPQHMAQIVRLYKDQENRLHLLWGRQFVGVLGVEEMWHAFSNDGGDTWTEPERFFVMERPYGVSMNGILEYDLVSDNTGCIHWTARTFEFRDGTGGNSSQQGSSGLYSRWCSADQQWRRPESLGFIRDLSFTAAMDEEEEMLFLFWTDETENGDQKAIYYSKKSLKDPEPTPVISQTGPLLLHANYPNPFNPTTRIPFTLEEPGEVEISVYDMAGRRVLQQHLGAKPAGLHFHEINMEGMTSGAYIYEVSMNGAWRRQNTMTFLK